MSTQANDQFEGAEVGLRAAVSSLLNEVNGELERNYGQSTYLDDDLLPRLLAASKALQGEWPEGPVANDDVAADLERRAASLQQCVDTLAERIAEMTKMCAENLLQRERFLQAAAVLRGEVPKAVEDLILLSVSPPPAVAESPAPEKEESPQSIEEAIRLHGPHALAKKLGISVSAVYRRLQKERKAKEIALKPVLAPKNEDGYRDAYKLFKELGATMAAARLGLTRGGLRYRVDQAVRLGLVEEPATKVEPQTGAAAPEIASPVVEPCLVPEQEPEKLPEDAPPVSTDVEAPEPVADEALEVESDVAIEHIPRPALVLVEEQPPPTPPAAVAHEDGIDLPRVLAEVVNSRHGQWIPLPSLVLTLKQRGWKVPPNLGLALDRLDEVLKLGRPSIAIRTRGVGKGREVRVHGDVSFLPKEPKRFTG